MIRRVPAHVWLEADTDARTVHLVIETVAADGEGDVELHRLDLTDSVRGPENAEARRKLRQAFTAADPA